MGPTGIKPEEFVVQLPFRDFCSPPVLFVDHNAEVFTLKDVSFKGVFGVAKLGGKSVLSDDITDPGVGAYYLFDVDLRCDNHYARFLALTDFVRWTEVIPPSHSVFAILSGDIVHVLSTDELVVLKKFIDNKGGGKRFV